MESVFGGVGDTFYGTAIMNRFFDRNKATILFAESWFFQLGGSLFFIKQ